MITTTTQKPFTKRGIDKVVKTPAGPAKKASPKKK